MPNGVIVLWNPFLDFPRELGLPARVGLINSLPEFIGKINRYNGKSTIFTSLYAFDQINDKGNRGVYNSARLRHLYFDIDEPKDLLPIRRLHTYCLEKDYLHTIFFSGGGFHTYVSAQFPCQLSNKKGAVANSQIHIADESKLEIGINGGFEIDGHIIGNLAQLVRVPNTYNLKRERYCIPISGKDLDTDLETIQKKAKRQQFGFYVYGKKFFDLKPFDCEPEPQKYEFKMDFGPSEGIGIGLDKVDVSRFPPCIRKLSTERFLSHRARFIVILYCKELGLPAEDTTLLLNKILAPKVFYHCVRQEGQVFWTYRRRDLNFPSCETLKAEGLCPDYSCSGAGLY